VILLRPASEADATTFEDFDLGDVSAAHLTEVAEIVRRLWPWVQDPSAVELDRQVHVAVEDGDIVGVVAHHLLVDEAGGVITGHRYLMVTAIQRRYQRGGYAAAILDVLFERMRDAGVDSVDWLVHPANHASIEFSNRVFPMAEETSPPESKPYLRYLLRLNPSQPSRRRARRRAT
jgi:RimJ/RimL family protein N-acetyltransferase